MNRRDWWNLEYPFCARALAQRLSPAGFARFPQRQIHALAQEKGGGHEARRRKVGA
jgi:hypothetical protein